MARIRSIKPEFWTSEQVAECSPSARLMFIGLWNFADDGGVLPRRPMQIKMQIFPGDPSTKDEVIGWIEELVNAGLLHVFESEGVEYLWVTGWDKHQRIDHPTYKYPRPFGKSPERSTSAREDSPNARSGEEGIGAEGIGSDRKGKEFNSDRKGEEANGSRSLQSPINLGEGEEPEIEPLDVSGLDWNHVTAMAEAVGKRIAPATEDDRRAWLRFAVLAETSFSEAWLAGAAEAVVHAKQTKSKRQSHFVAVLKSKARDEYGVDDATFLALLRRIEIPAAVWKSKVLGGTK